MSELSGVPESYSSEYPLGFTGGIVPETVQKWLSRYGEATRGRPVCISDMQTGLREGKDRSQGLSRLVRS